MVAGYRKNYIFSIMLQVNYALFTHLCSLPPLIDLTHPNDSYLPLYFTGDHAFKDKYLFYEFYASESSDHSSLNDEDNTMDESTQFFDIRETGAQTDAKAFRDAIDVRDRRYHMKLYPKVFVGCGKFRCTLFKSYSLVFEVYA